MCVCQEKVCEGPHCSVQEIYSEQNEKAVTYSECQLTDYPLKYLLANIFGIAVIGALKACVCRMEKFSLK